MLSRVKIATLFSIAGGCGIGVGVMVLLLRGQTNEFASKGLFVTTATKIINNQPQVDELLGKPFQLGRANLQDGWSKMEQDYVQVRIPVSGVKDKAIMWAYAKRQEDNKIQLVKLEMTFDKVPNKKMVLLEEDNVKKGTDGDVVAEKSLA